LTSNFRLGEWLVQPALNDLTRDDRTAHLEPKVMQVLVSLAARPGQVLSKEEILQDVWAGTFVTDEVLTNAVWELRKALGDDARSPRFIQTVPRRGYRLVAPVTVLEERPTAPEPQGEATPSEPPITNPPIRPGPSRPRSPQRSPFFVLLLVLLAAAALALTASRWYDREGREGTETLALERQGKKLSVAVTSFDNNTGDPLLDRLSKGIAEILMTNLSQSRYLQVVDPSEPGSGEAEREATGYAAGAQVVVDGSVMKTGNNFRVDIRVYDVKSGKFLMAQPAKGAGEETIWDLVETLSSKIRVTLEIKVAGSPEEAEGIDRTRTTFLDAYRNYALGKENLNKLYFKEAISHLQEAIRIDPQYAYAYDLLANAYDAIGEKELAKSSIQKAVQVSSDFPELERLWILRRDAQVRGDTRAELKFLKKLAMLQPKEAEWYFLMGSHYYFHARSCEYSINAYKEAIRIEPRRPLYHCYLGYAYLACAQAKEALESFEVYLSMEPEAADAHDSLGTAYLLTGNYERALEEFEQAIAIKPDFSYSWLNIGDVYLARGMANRSLDYYEKYESQAMGKEGEGRASYRKAKAYLEMGRSADAIRSVRAALAADPDMLEAYWIWGLAEIQRNNLDKAENILEKMQVILDASGSHYREEFLHHLAGSLFLERQDFDAAVEEFKKALQMMPLEQAFFRNALAEAYYRQGDYKSAAGHVQKALSLNPNYPDSRWMLGQILEKGGRKREAIEEYSRVVEIWRETDVKTAIVEDARKRINHLLPRRR
jgi:tetratricopeptide (TPR) repeat protein/DNA-binding winged helix-turn-helix (wHTH) protein